MAFTLGKWPGMLALLLLAGCQQQPKMETTDAIVDAQLNVIARATSEQDGRVIRDPALTPDDVGQKMRVGASKAPPDH